MNSKSNTGKGEKHLHPMAGKANNPGSADAHVLLEPDMFFRGDMDCGHLPWI